MSKSKKVKSRFTLSPDKVAALLDSQPDKTYSFKELARELDLNSKQEKIRLSEILQEMTAMKRLMVTKEEAFRSKATPQNAQEIEGILDHVNPRFGFIVSDDAPVDIKVNTDQLKGAVDGDRVRVLVYARKASNRASRRHANPEGEVLQVLERNRTEYVGRIEVSERHAFVIPDNRRMYEDIFVRKEDLNGAKNGEKVIVQVVEWPEGDFQPVGKVKDVLGPAGAHNTEMHAIMAEYGLPYSFPETIEKEAEAIPEAISKKEIAKRRDFRDVLTFTIDPVDAKDFDDALSIQKLENGHWEVGVHIADVTHYVQLNTQLEREAERRATSVYLVDRVVPMLPERLSNGLCSLRPHEDKLTFSAVFELDDQAHIVNEWFGRTIIHSDHRFAYEDAQEVLEGRDDTYQEELLVLNRLAHKLREDRFRRGAIGFETTEVRFKLAEDGTPLEVVPKVRKDAHKLIEEFMLLANKQVATFVYHLRKGRKKNPMVYRVHESPDPDKLLTFANFAQRFGYKVEAEGKNMSQSLHRMVTAMEGKPEQDLLQTLAIRTMAKARYTLEPLGHFGLAFEHYTHFTSPIRRYPDMMAHRLLQHYLDGGQPVDPEPWEKLAKHSSDREKQAADAERASVKYKQVEFMKLQDPNRTYEGIVSGLSEYGIYVEIIETKCEGMVRMSDIEDDYYELDPENYRAVGRRSKRIIAFGDTVQVRVLNTDLEKRIIDLEFAGTNGRKPSRKGGGKTMSRKSRTR
ncbi:ribonuclease R [Catalinimonas alkaloidigena]|uniref:Ribonuclease R n=1 Tax=Catalinimonas alkaloidigena TaxID=1075417 RepID=A0A1G9F6M7_9BACT|nr:ribonuclease R [Catalinimonas alkaloidigena]SDK84038.1 ribonuclease R [Catalinimonas alkaloidigena]